MSRSLSHQLNWISTGLPIEFAGRKAVSWLSWQLTPWATERTLSFSCTRTTQSKKVRSISTKPEEGKPKNWERRWRVIDEVVGKKKTRKKRRREKGCQLVVMFFQKQLQGRAAFRGYWKFEARILGLLHLNTNSIPAWTCNINYTYRFPILLWPPSGTRCMGLFFCTCKLNWGSWRD